MSVRDPGKLFSNANKIVEESVKRSDFALSLTVDQNSGFSSGTFNTNQSGNAVHYREYSGLPRKVCIDPTMNQDLRIAETGFPTKTHDFLRREVLVSECVGDMCIGAA